MSKRLRVLLSNDDGPPSSRDSPYVYGFSRYLERELGWDVKVVVPSSQKSWVGKSFQIKEITRGRYYYPRDPNGEGETSPVSRPLREGETAEWVLLGGTPATCVNVALHNLYPGQIDLVLSGPNLGRNTSVPFALSSGTIGAAMAGSLSLVRGIAVSFGTVIHPTPTEWYTPAYTVASRVIQKLLNEWGGEPRGLRGDGEVDLYSINVPMIESLLSQEGLPVCWTYMWRTSYGQLFQRVEATQNGVTKETIKEGGPDANTSKTEQATLEKQDADELTFKFSPQWKNLIRPSGDDLPEGSDAWALHHGYVAVTPLMAGFTEPSLPSNRRGEEHIDDRIWRMKL